MSYRILHIQIGTKYYKDFGYDPNYGISIDHDLKFDPKQNDKIDPMEVFGTSQLNVNLKKIFQNK